MFFLAMNKFHNEQCTTHASKEVFASTIFFSLVRIKSFVLSDASIVAFYILPSHIIRTLLWGTGV